MMSRSDTLRAPAPPDGAAPPAGLLSVEEAVGRVLAGVSPLEAEHVPLADATGRRLAEALQAKRTQPPFPASAMDGYAVRAADAGPGAQLKVIGVAAAGRGFRGRVGPGETVRIFTGAPVPEGADAVLIQEDADRVGDDAVIVREAMVAGTQRSPGRPRFPGGRYVSCPRAASWTWRRCRSRRQ